MEAKLKQAIADHGLTGIGANIFDASTGLLTVYVHWIENGSDRGCASGSGPTFDGALAVAVAEMSESRPRRAA
jgi:hypothetical protein